MNKNTKQACKLITATKNKKKKKRTWTLFIEVIRRKGFSQRDRVLHFKHSYTYEKRKAWIGDEE